MGNLIAVSVHKPPNAKLCCISTILCNTEPYKHASLPRRTLRPFDDFIYLSGFNRTCSQFLFCQTSHWAKVLLQAKGCNLSRTWLVWPRPITACLSGSSVWQAVNQPGPLQEPWSRAARHRQHFIPNNLPAGSPLCVEDPLALWAEVRGWRRLGIFLKTLPFFFFSFFVLFCSSLPESPKRHFDRLRCGRRQHAYLPSIGSAFSLSEKAAWLLWMQLLW